jgi:hypothetical protein
MHHRKQISTTSIYRIQTPKPRAELSVRSPGSAIAAPPLTEKELRFKTRRSKHPSPDDKLSPLARFASQHGFLVEIHDAQVPQSDLHFIHRICFEGAYISDPYYDPFLLDSSDSKDATLSAFEESKIESPLALFISEDQISRLVDRIGFDIADFENGNAGTLDPDNTNWGAILNRTGLRYVVGSNYGMWILFSSTDDASVALALALARIQ